MDGLSGHIGSIWKMMNRANCEDGILTACGKARSLEDLSNEVVDEMETDHLHVLIQEAFVRGNYLIVINKAGREIRVPFDQVPVLTNRLRFRDRLNFTIDDDGSCLYWESADIHLDFEALLYYVDTDFQARVDRQTAKRRRVLGDAIGRVRTAYKLSINDITGLEPNEVQDIEAGRLYARATNLCCYSETIGITLGEFLEKVATHVDFKVLEAIA